jgi:hypothetical protein
MAMTRGVYCLGNDRVAEWVGPFLASLRQQEPSLPVYMIPFDERVDEFRRLASDYGAKIYDPPALSELDAMGREIWPRRWASWRMFRKLAVFLGPLEHFLFLDSDVVVLEPVGRLIDQCAEREEDFVYFDADMDFAYRPGEFRERMKREFGAHGFSAGSFITSRDVLPWESIGRMVHEAAAFSDEFPPGVGDQPVLNYCVDVAGLSKARAAELFPDVAWTCFAGWPDLEVVPGPRVRARSDGRVAPFLHWAGDTVGPRMPHRDLFKHFRSLHRRRSGRSPLRATWRRFLPQR